MQHPRRLQAMTINKTLVAAAAVAGLALSATPADAAKK
jgi:hypothetical protein